jgi:hypothetical protein
MRGCNSGPTGHDFTDNNIKSKNVRFEIRDPDLVNAWDFAIFRNNSNEFWDFVSLNHLQYLLGGRPMKVGFLATQVFGILRSQIETKRMLSLASVLIALRHSYLQVQNLDQIITIINNWINNSHLNCTPNMNLKNYLMAEIDLTKDNYEQIKKVEYFEELQVDED